MSHSITESHRGTPRLAVRGLSLSLEGRQLLDGVDLSLAEGEIHALIGSNGAGKSSLAYALIGSEGYRPQSGEIVFQGQSLLDLTMHERARLGMTLAWQEPARIEGLTVRDYLLLGNRAADPAACLERVALDPTTYLTRRIGTNLKAPAAAGAGPSLAIV